MRDCVREICVLSIFCGAALSLCPECGAKKVLKLLESLVLLAVILNGVGKLDLAPYSAELARLHEKEAEIKSSSEELRNRLDRFVIEDEYRSYVEERAEALGLSPVEIRIRARWSMEGLWVPDSSWIRMKSDPGRNTLSDILSSELGIPVERQEWITDD